MPTDDCIGFPCVNSRAHIMLKSEYDPLRWKHNISEFQFIVERITAKNLDVLCINCNKLFMKMQLDVIQLKLIHLQMSIGYYTDLVCDYNDVSFMTESGWQLAIFPNCFFFIKIESLMYARLISGSLGRDEVKNCMKRNCVEKKPLSRCDHCKTV